MLSGAFDLNGLYVSGHLTWSADRTLLNGPPLSVMMGRGVHAIPHGRREGSSFKITKLDLCHAAQADRHIWLQKCL